MSKANAASKPGAERRRSKRTDLLDTFSLFVSVPKKGPHRLKVYDLSDIGIGFDLDIEEEGMPEFPVESGDSLGLDLYLNQSLSIPLQVVVRRVQVKEGVRRVGAEIASKDTAGASAVRAFLEMLEAISSVAKTS